MCCRPYISRILQSLDRLALGPVPQTSVPSQPCHGHIPSSVFLVERRGICVHPVQSVVAPAVHRVGPPAREPGQCAMSLFPTSPHYLLPLLLTLLILSTADDRRLGAVSGFCFSFFCSSVASYLSPTPLVVCLLHVHCLFPCHLRSVGREELFACLIVSLCSNRSSHRVFFLFQSVMVSSDSLSFSVSLRGRFVGLAQDGFCFFS